MVESEQQMVRPEEELQARREFTSLQRTYEDSIPPDLDDWSLEGN